MQHVFLIRRLVACCLAALLFMGIAAGTGGYAAAATSSAAPPDTTESDVAYRVYTADGTPASLDAVAATLDTVDVMLLGEVHEQPGIHALQDSLWQRALNAPDSRPAALSLEMFERDVQPVLDEYLAGLITENHFLQASRPWTNYVRDYHPLVESARAAEAAVLAANAPRRYVNRVAREGRTALNALPASACNWLPPLPYPEATNAYRDRFLAQMHGGAHPTNHAPSDTTDAHTTREADPPDSPHGHGEGMTRLLDAQTLWDATMAYAMAEHLLRTPDARIVHLTGRFHVAQRTGTPDALRHYRPDVRQLVVYFDVVADPDRFDENAHANRGDFVVLVEN